jgi:DNA-binding beta-propeller fold protein YncE
LLSAFGSVGQSLEHLQRLGEVLDRLDVSRPPEGVLGTFAVGAAPKGVVFDGANIWVANSDDGTVTKLRASDGSNMGTFLVGSGPEGVAFDGANIWVANRSGSTVSKR